MSNKSNKGFTFIELLVTILITALVMIGAIFLVREILKSSENNKNKINIINIKESASQYITEFKNEEKYWFVDNASSENEYACTTVGMLINKGILNNDIIGTIVNINNEKKEITKNTSIKVERNRITKVHTDEVLFHNSECLESTEIDVNFEITDGTKGKNNWYISDVLVQVTINTNNSSQIGSVSFNLVNGDDTKEIVASRTDNIVSNLRINEEGSDIDLCVVVTTLKDIDKTYCLSEQKGKLKIDTTVPSNPKLNLEKRNNYYLISNNASDNISNNNLTYYLYTEDKSLINVISPNSNEAVYQINTPDNFNLRKAVITYVEDEAGNISSKVKKNLQIEDSQTKEPIKNINWYCSLNNNTYANETDAKNNCSKPTNGIVSNSTVYTCSFNSNEYTTWSAASSACTKTNYGTISVEYSCDGKSSSSSTCTKKDETTVNGSITCTYHCSYTDFVWKFADSSSTNYGCPSGYSKSSYECEYDSVAGSSCSVAGDIKEVTYSCTNHCSKTSTYPADKDYYCSLGYYVSSSSSDCSEDNSGSVSAKTIYTCSFNTSTKYSSQTAARNACTKTITGTTSSKTTYTCPLTNNTFNSINDAKNDCTNYCSLGQYYDNKCYILR